jgi:glucose-1-phosphate adenylyltransferase
VSKVLDSRVLAMVLAGGRGQRLGPLTDNRSKPAVPFGKHHIINFALSNIINSKVIDHAYVLTQYKQQGILRILAGMNFEAPAWDKFIRPLPAQQQLGTDWYLGSANAVYQNHEYLTDDPAEYVLILAADHIYKFDFKQLLEAHIENNADVTISGMFLKTEEAANTFGVMDVDAAGVIHGFKEKPPHPKAHPERPGECVISQGIYIFKKTTLLKVLQEDYINPNSEHDFGKDILPKMVAAGYSVRFYDHGTNVIPNEKIRGYWRDVGTIDAYHAAMMDQTQFNPDLDLYNRYWPIITIGDNQPMAKVNSLCSPSDEDKCLQFLAAGGAVFTRAQTIRHSVLGRAVRVEEGAVVQDSVILDKASIGRGARVTRTIVEEKVVIPDDCIIGEDVDTDEERDVLVTASGVRVVHSRSKL